LEIHGIKYKFRTSITCSLNTFRSWTFIISLL